MPVCVCVCVCLCLLFVSGGECWVSLCLYDSVSVTGCVSGGVCVCVCVRVCVFVSLGKIAVEGVLNCTFFKASHGLNSENYHFVNHLCAYLRYNNIPKLFTFLS